MGSERFTQLVDEHYASLYRLAWSLSRNSTDACDLVQQTFFIWAMKGHALREAPKAKAWLFTTLYREFLRTKRLDSRAISLEMLPPDASELAAEEVDRLAHLDSATVMAALQTLGEVHRAPLTLFYLESLSYREIGHTLGLPVGTVMSRLSRGKAQLRVVLAREEAMGRARLGLAVA